MTFEELTALALALPPASRVDLAETLVASLAAADFSGFSREWEEEIKRRLKSIEEGTAEFVDADEVFAELDQEFGR